MKLHDTAFQTVQPESPRRFTAGDAAFLTGVGDRQLREAQDYLGVVGDMPAQADEWYQGDHVEFIDPTGRRTAGQIHELDFNDRSAVVRVGDDAYTVVPIDMLAPMGRQAKVAAIRETVKSALKGGGGAGMLKESRELIPLDSSNQAFGMTLQYDRGLAPSEADVLSYVAHKYPGASVLDADDSFPGKLSVALMFERTAQGEVPMVSPKTPMSDKNRGPGAPAFIDDEVGGFDEAASVELEAKTGGVLVSLAAANPGVDFVETSIERDAGGVISHFALRAGGAPLFFRPIAAGRIGLTKILGSAVSPAMGFVAAGRDDSLRIALHGPRGEVSLSKCAGLFITAAQPEHGTGTGPLGERFDAPDDNNVGNYAIHAGDEDEDEGFSAGPGLNVASVPFPKGKTKEYYEGYGDGDGDPANTQGYWKQLIEPVKRKPIANMRAVCAGLTQGLGRAPTGVELAHVATKLEQCWRREAHRRVADAGQPPSQGLQINMLLNTAEGRAKLDQILAQAIAKNPAMLSGMDDAAYSTMVNSMMQSDENLERYILDAEQQQTLFQQDPGAAPRETKLFSPRTWFDSNTIWDKGEFAQAQEQHQRQQQQYQDQRTQYEQLLQRRRQNPHGTSPGGVINQPPPSQGQPQQQGQGQPSSAAQPYFGPLPGTVPNQPAVTTTSPTIHDQPTAQPGGSGGPIPAPPPRARPGQLPMPPTGPSEQRTQPGFNPMIPMAQPAQNQPGWRSPGRSAPPAPPPRGEQTQELPGFDDEGLAGVGEDVTQVDVPTAAPTREEPASAAADLPSVPEDIAPTFDEQSGTFAPPDGPVPARDPFYRAPPGERNPDPTKPPGLPGKPLQRPKTPEERAFGLNMPASKETAGAELSTAEALEEGRRAAGSIRDAAGAKALAQDLNERLSAKDKAEGMQVLVPEIGQRYSADSMQIVGTQNVPGRRSGEIVAIQSLGMLRNGEPVGGAKAGVIVAARRRSAQADQPKVRPPKLGPQHTYDDPTPRTYHSEDAADLYAGRRQPATGNMYFQLKDLRRSGDYVVGTVMWEPERTKMMSSGNIQHNIISFVKGRSTQKDRLDLGNIGRVRVRMLDVHSGIAEVYFRSSEARALPPEFIEREEGPSHHDNLI